MRGVWKTSIAVGLTGLAIQLLPWEIIGSASVRSFTSDLHSLPIPGQHFKPDYSQRSMTEIDKSKVGVRIKISPCIAVQIGFSTRA